MKYYKLDKDVKQYLKRMNVDGIKTPSDIYSVNDFVFGLKDLNLWGNIVFWPLRSSQNAGTGNTIYSLGGIGIFNATKTSGISWQANGLLANTASQYVSFSDPIDLTTLNSASLLAILDFSSLTTSTWFSNIFAVRTDSFNPNASGLKILLYSDATSNNLEGGGSSIFPDNNELKRSYNRGSGAYIGTKFHSLLASLQANPNQVEFFYDGVSQGSLSDTTTSTVFVNKGSFNYFLGTSAYSSVATMIGSFNAVFNTYISSSDQLNIYSLYKSTLGKGLNLP
jgi:hypothetical protein